MLIGLTGKAGSGKDQSFKYIKEWADAKQCHVKRDAFADRLKWSAARIFFPMIEREAAVDWCNMLKSDLGNSMGNRVGVIDDHGSIVTVSGRQFLQRYGTEAHRDIFGLDFWIKAVMDEYDPSEITVVTDVRFANEAHAIRGERGTIWEIRRPGQEIAESDHASEQDLPSELIDCVVVNEGTLEHLQDMINSLMNRAVAL